MEKVRYGIIGIGNMGSSHSKKFLAGEIENGVLAAICDLNPAKTDAVKALEGAENVAVFTDYKEMYASGLIDAVIVAVPHYDHPRLSIEAMEAGLHVVCEKPAGVYTKQVKEMNAVAAKSDKLFTMMFNQRTNCVYRKMHDMIANGESLHDPEFEKNPRFSNNKVIYDVKRIGDGFDEWLLDLGYKREGEYYRVLRKNDDNVIMVSHGGASSAALAHLFSLPFLLTLSIVRADYTAITIVSLEGEEGKLALPRFDMMNDSKHIQGIEAEKYFGN